METIVDRLAGLCTAESVEASEEALTLIARAATGSLRDAENILEQALVSYGSPLREDAVSDLLDLGNDQRALELVGHVVDKATQQGLTVINKVAADGVDLRQFHRATTEYLRGVLLLKSGAATALGYPEETRAEMQKMAGRASLGHLLGALKTFVGASVGRDSSSPLALELAMVESALDQPVSPTADALEPSPAPQPRPQQRRQEAARERPAPAASYDPSPPARAAPAPRPETNQPRSQAPSRDRAAAPPAAAGPLGAVWNEVLRSLGRQKGRRFNLGALLRSSTAREIDDGTIVIRYAHSSHRERIEEELDDPQTRRVVEEAFAQALGESYKIRVSEAEASDGGARRNPVQSSHLVRAAVAKGAQVAGDKEDQSE
jgi:DNA polymerase-3 subunit gamma/tau